MIASIIVFDQREDPWFHRQEFFDSQSGSSLVDPGMSRHVLVRRETSAVLIGPVSEYPEDNFLSGFECDYFEN
jgi:hypothetical protein